MQQCRQCSVPRTLDEIGEVSRVSRKEIGRTYRFISRELSLKLMPTSPIDYVPRFCSGLNLKGEVQSRGVEILRQASEKELTSGRGPNWAWQQQQFTLLQSFVASAVLSVKSLMLQV